MYSFDCILDMLSKLNMEFSSHKPTGKISPLTSGVKWYICILNTFWIHFVSSPWTSPECSCIKESTDELSLVVPETHSKVISTFKMRSESKAHLRCCANPCQNHTAVNLLCYYRWWLSRKIVLEMYWKVVGKCVVLFGILLLLSELKSSTDN